jgi:hypothetical protein
MAARHARRLARTRAAHGFCSCCGGRAAGKLVLGVERVPLMLDVNQLFGKPHEVSEPHTNLKQQSNDQAEHCTYNSRRVYPTHKFPS